ncbi:MAG: hypothetical protein GW941_01900 [Candidatus Pacebacteria bacterium]|nr:hypothetical protein [Candidatus Paceibacterota bacterium]
MKKELFLAILIGLVVGLVIVFGFYRTKVVLTPKNDNPILTESPSPEASADIISNLVIHSPLNESIQNKEEVTIAGSTNNNEFVVIMVNEKDFVTTADDSGNFSISTILETGSNIIEINSINEDGKITTEELTVIFTTEPLLDSEQTTEENTETDETTQNEQ